MTDKKCANLQVECMAETAGKLRRRCKEGKRMAEGSLQSSVVLQNIVRRGLTCCEFELANLRGCLCRCCKRGLKSEPLHSPQYGGYRTTSQMAADADSSRPHLSPFSILRLLDFAVAVATAHAASHMADKKLA